MKTKRKYPLAPSQEFLSVLPGGISLSHQTCDYCGRQHLAVDSHNQNCDDAAIAYKNSLIDEAKEAPDDWILVPEVDFISSYEIDGLTFPDNCPCNGLSRYEQFMWNNKDVWKKYLAVRKLAAQAEIDAIGDI